MLSVECSTCQSSRDTVLHTVESKMAFHSLKMIFNTVTLETLDNGIICILRKSMK